MAAKKNKDEELTLEENMELLRETAEKLEDDDITLEESFKLYSEGMELLKKCEAQIDTVEKKVLALNEEMGTEEFE